MISIICFDLKKIIIITTSTFFKKILDSHYLFPYFLKIYKSWIFTIRFNKKSISIKNIKFSLNIYNKNNKLLLKNQKTLLMHIFYSNHVSCAFSNHKFTDCHHRHRHHLQLQLVYLFRVLFVKPHLLPHTPYSPLPGTV